eukprot:TRINITY_DN5216_c0_g1_i3.p1 TRINITY_DN5216_c0_g1~~TRINITY_DN5216_c0_g1_i3.p1  ORF type:complete len:377 (-),score=101.84 TRINITY_DN5216_c0_g1_i3:540-1580(-)
MEENKVTLAYEHRRYDKICRTLSESKDSQVLLDTLSVLLDITHKRENIVSVVNAGIVPILGELVSNSDKKIRKRVVHVFAKIAEVSCGRTSLKEEGIVGMLKKTIDDVRTSVRDSVCLVLVSQSLSQAGCQALLDEGWMKIIVQKLQVEERKPCTLMLQTMRCLLRLQDGIDHALEENLIEVLATFINDGTEREITTLSAHCVALLASDQQGKMDTVQSGVAEGLVVMLRLKDMESRLAASSALMVMTIHKEGKEDAIEHNITPYLMFLMKQWDQIGCMLLANTLQIISNLAEDSTGRLILKSTLPYIEMALEEFGEGESAGDDGTDLVLKNGNRAVERLTATLHR